MAFSDDFEADLNDPVLKKDIELSQDKLDFLEGNQEKCFLCKWMLADYKKNGTFTGYKQSGAQGTYELFPVRGEINHLWLELFQKPYPFKKKVTPQEATVTGAPPFIPPHPTPAPAPPPLARPAPPPPLSAVVIPAEPPPVVKNIDSIPMSKPKK